MRYFNEVVDRLREENKESYHLSKDASEELSRNDSYSIEYGERMWEEFYSELEQEYLDKLSLKGNSNGR